MKSNCVIPIHEIVKILKPKPVEFISVIPFFQFSICLRMLDASFDVFDFIHFKEVFKSAICIAVLVSLIGIELCPSIGQNLPDTCQPAKFVHGFFEELQSVIRCFGIKLPARENAPQAIIKDRADVHFFSAMNACMPIQMHHG